jgi:thermopsin
LKISSASGAFLIALLIVSSPIALAPHDASASATYFLYQLVVPSGYYQPVQIDAPSSNTTIFFSISSNASLSTALMTNSQFSSFNNSDGEISASLFLQNGTTAQHSMSIPEGVYYLVFFAYGNTANVSYNYQTYPISPFLVVPLTPPEPTGVASFGLYNNSGDVTSYTIESSDAVGVADITAFQAYNSSAAASNDTLSGATLQLNSILAVNEQGGLQQFYWVQNTPDFVTSASQVAWADNIWNFSVSGVLSNSTITSQDGGYAFSYYNNGNPGYYYSFESSNSTYRLPLQLALIISETTIPGTGVLVQMGEQEIGNGSAPAQAINWFDNATIHDPTVQSAAFYVSGNVTTPNGLYSDTELVFGGEGNGEATHFTQLSASLGLFYGNSTAGTQTAFPSYYDFGGDTGEATDDLSVYYSGNGFSTVSVGTPDYVYLGAASGTYTLPLAGTTVSTSFSAASSASTTSQSSSSGSASSFPLSYLAAVFVLASVAALLTLSARNARKAGPKIQ